MLIYRSYYMYFHLPMSTLPFAGTDEDALIAVLAHRSLEQRLELVTMFKTMYGKVCFRSRMTVLETPNGFLSADWQCFMNFRIFRTKHKHDPEVFF